MHTKKVSLAGASPCQCRMEYPYNHLVVPNSVLSRARICHLFEVLLVRRRILFRMQTSFLHLHRETQRATGTSIHLNRCILLFFRNENDVAEHFLLASPATINNFLTCLDNSNPSCFTTASSLFGKYSKSSRHHVEPQTPFSIMVSFVKIIHSSSDTQPKPHDLGMTLGKHYFTKM